jgi:alpha-tubulin suppressor-like RCC1 family protein
MPRRFRCLLPFPPDPMVDPLLRLLPPYPAAAVKLNRALQAPGLFAAIALIASAALACGGSGTEPRTDVKVSAVIIDQSSFAIERGYHAPLTATVKNDAGATVPVPVVWRSSVETVATLDANGRLVALDTGTTLVSASTLGVTSQPILVRVVWQGAAKIETYQFTAPAAASPSGTVPDSIRARVLDLKGNPVPGVRIAFTPTVGGGTVTPAIDTTDRNGIASAQWTLGSSNGANQATAAVIDEDGKPLTFVAGGPATFVVTTFNAVLAVDGNDQTGQVLSKLPLAPSVKVVDANGNPRPGVPVTFTPTAGGRVATSTVSTGADGIASPGTWTLGDVTGDQQLLVSVEAARFALHATGTGTAVHLVPTSVSAGGFATCAITTSGQVSCWGQQPLVGDGGSANATSPTPTKGGVSFTQLRGSPTHFCGVAVDQSIYCWGVNALADTTGTNAGSPTPQQLASTQTWTMVAPGYAHNCAIASDGLTYCWGDNTAGQLGDRTTTRRFAPAAIYGGYRFSTITSGSNHSCGLASDGSAFCWGSNSGGQLGDGTTTSRVAPTAVSGGLTFQSIGAGEALTCALSTAGKAYCWGTLAGATPPQQLTPKAVTTALTFTQITVGGGHACALTADGTAYCWGDNRGGQLGDSTTTNRTDPVAVAGGMKFRSISAGYEHTCAQTLDGSVACWGLNSVGELGNSSTGPQIVPRYVVIGVNP